MTNTKPINFTANCNGLTISRGLYRDTVKEFLYGQETKEYAFWSKYVGKLNKHSKALGLDAHYYINVGC